MASWGDSGCGWRKKPQGNLAMVTMIAERQGNEEQLFHGTGAILSATMKAARPFGRRKQKKEKQSGKTVQTPALLAGKKSPGELCLEKVRDVHLAE